MFCKKNAPTFSVVVLIFIFDQLECVFLNDSIECCVSCARTYSQKLESQLAGACSRELEQNDPSVLCGVAFVDVPCEARGAVEGAGAVFT